MFGKSKSLYLLDDHVNEFALLIERDIVVEQERVLLHINSKFILLLAQALQHVVEAHADYTLLNKEDLVHLLLLVEQKLLVLSRAVLSRLEAKGNVVEELTVNMIELAC